MGERRPIIVLASLLTAMTLTGSLLLLLDPGESPISDAPALQSVENNLKPEAVLFQTAQQISNEQWQAIVIRYSGQNHDNATTIDQRHQRLGLGGLGYHFVINNGSAAPDGQVEVGFRWMQQLNGAHSQGQNAFFLNSNAIGICLVGDAATGRPTEAQMQQLVWLVHQLQLRFDIPADRVMVETGDGLVGSPVRAFPVGEFRQQLLAPARH